jgi:hypothetical protein
MTGEVQPQDKDSELVERPWERVNRRTGVLTQRTLEGEHVRAAWLDRRTVHRAAGTVRRNDAGERVVEAWAAGIRQETAVPRDAKVDLTGRGP